MSRRKKPKVEIHDLDEKYNPLIEEEEVSDTSEKSKVGVGGTSESKLLPSSDGGNFKKKPSATVVPEAQTNTTQQSSAPVTPVKNEKDEDIELDSEQDDPAGLYSCSLIVFSILSTLSMCFRNCIPVITNG